MQQVAVKMVEEKEGRENRESGITLAQVGTKNNDTSGVDQKLRSSEVDPLRTIRHREEWSGEGRDR